MDKVFIEIMNTHLQEELNINNQNKDLKELGLDSLASIELLLEIEEAYEIIFPDELLTEDTFSSSHNLWSIVSKLKGE
ncbi:phosphopantetheine-binding protein [Bacillus toyonensis]|uniref:phosphopantetheine-binding protein n=1 Tax=Bacillus TaxID=1386 RepID=UPI0002E53188|nr:MULTISPECIES: phosphopantetheine-binding protein [Bacillus]MDH8705353.1 acyl carrier protein [Stenotrophomonas sp. 1198]MCH5471052.1 phosphopantetheine-binding protein [Bacillus toyonensis]MCU4771078.1 phosphopantetheine-binding protein [Bacillus toyonensis]MCU5490600.1 phosphopantetheine-binding protein [Bacillus cereus]MCU5584387.1 phosphopantetheine-binding protein [Bacillus toyonensis]